MSGLFAVPKWTVAREACLFTGFSRQEYWEWVVIPSSRSLPAQRWNRDWQAGSYHSRHLDGDTVLTYPGVPKGRRRKESSSRGREPGGEMWRPACSRKAWKRTLP